MGGQGYFGASRGGGTRSHQGLDISAYPASAVYASRAGVVTQVVNKDNGGYGKYIVIDHGDGTTTKYAHNILNLVVSTMYVPEGRVIALSGQTGNAHGQPRSEAHVHFEIRKKGRPVDPATLLKFSCLNWRINLP